MSDKKFKVQLHEPKPLSWWRARRNKIDMKPPYQRRGGLWSRTDKAYLIDSIINGYDVPKLYLADFTWGDSPINSSRLPYAIIDGKQRFEAIFDFFDGTVTLNDNFEYLADSTLNLGGLGYKDLQKNHAEIAELFETYPLTIMSVYAESEERINDLFVRLNRSKSLTGAEIRNAMSGPAPQVVRSISDHDFFRDNISFSVKRGADLNSAAKLLIFEFNERPVETKKSSLDLFVNQVDSTRSDKLELAARRVFELLTVMTGVFLPNDRLLSAGGILPVYYWFIRNADPANYFLVREFLISFENTRKSNRMLEGLGESVLDKSLVDFDNLNRSTNDLQSHIGRVKILQEKFSIWALDRQR